MVTKAEATDAMVRQIALAGCWRPETCRETRGDEVCWRCQEQAATALQWTQQAGLAAVAVTPDQWQRLPSTCYGLLGMLNSYGSGPREDVADLSHALAILRDLLRRRPAEHGGPMEVR